MLLWTCEHAVAPHGCVLMFYTHHRPHLAERDMAFFDVARETGWACEKVLTERFAVRLRACADVLSRCRLLRIDVVAYVSGG